ncbi:uncharacterized protein LOC123312429 [Coccinella septempunctata]|uniref:uncharacterized protein LOC123312429 n=1 Tax=Coccinella septempunctata TaxID=41139 RepID=UPI001D07BEBE|nr:uncharacterized protein LOC123312429 [Coccinella septempunctata]
MCDSEYLMEGVEPPMRVYYGNVCAKCFKRSDLFKCEKCKGIQYCSKKHQMQDWPFHKRICSYLKTPKCYKGMDERTFYYEKFNFMLGMRDHLGSNLMNHFEKELCLLPWLCKICYSADNLDLFVCEGCYSVPYCSMEHKKQDLEMHKKICGKLNLGRLMASLGYENGHKVKLIQFDYESIRQGERHFPTSMKGLLKLLQRQVRFPRNDCEALNISIFGDRYAAAATILSALENSDYIIKRKFNWSPNKQLSQVTDKNPKAKKKFSGTLVIHIVQASDYEMNIHWPNYVGLLLDWLINVHHVKIILVGKDLLNFEAPNFDSINHLATCEVYTKDYQDVVDKIDRPDIVVLYNFGYPKMSSLNEFVKSSGLLSLVKYSQVPVVLTSAFVIFLKKLSIGIALLQRSDIEMALTMNVNQFSDCRSIRFWDKTEFLCGHLNEVVTIFRKK